MTAPFKHLPDASKLISSLPDDSVLSRDASGDEDTKVILFGFSAG